MATRILVVEDDRDVLDSLATDLSNIGYEVEACASSQQAVDRLSRQDGDYQIILLDWMLESPEGSSRVIEKARGISQDFPVIVFTGDPNENSPGAILKGASWYIRKPFDPAELNEIIQHFTEQDANLHSIARTAREITELDQVLIWRFSDPRRHLKLAAWADSSSISTQDRAVVIEAGNRSLLRMLQNDTPIVLENIRGTSKYHTPIFAARHDWNHVIGIPLRYLGREFGFLEGFSKEGWKSNPDRQPAIEKNLQAFARQASESINHIELARKNRSLINGISNLTAEQPRLELFTEAILKIGIDLVVADAGWFFLVDFENGMLRQLTPSSSQKAMPARYYPLREDNLLCSAARDGSVKVVSDINNLERYGGLKPLKLQKYRSQVIIPLKRGDLTIGVVVLAGRIPGAFQKGDLEVLRSYASLAGSALDQAKLRYHLQLISQAVMKGHGFLQDAVIHAILELLGKSVALWLWDEDKQVFAVPAALGVSENFKQKAHIGYTGRDDSLLAHAFLTKQPVNCGDLENPPAGLVVKLDNLLRKEKWMSTLLVPIFDPQEKPIGAIAIKRDVKGAFSQFEVEFLSNFASQVAIAFENHRRRVNLSRQLESFQEIIRTVGVTGSDPLPVILEKAARLLKADHGSFALVDRANNRLAYRAIWEEGKILTGEQIPERHRFQDLGKGIAGFVASGQAEIYYVPDLTMGDSHYLQWYEGTLSEFTVPLKDDQGNIMGVLNLESNLQDAFSLPQRELCQSLATIAADVVEKSELFDRMEKLNRQIQILHDIAQESDLESILKQVLYGIVELYGSQTCSSSITLYDDNKQHFLETIVAVGPIANQLSFPPREAGGLGGFVVQTREPIYIETRQQLPPEIKGFNPGLLKAGIVSSAALPLKRQGQNRLLGVLFIHEKQQTNYSQDLRRILQIYSNQAAITIENALAFDQRKRDLEALRDVVNVIGTTDPLPLVLEKAIQILEADHGHISVVDEELLVHVAFWQEGAVVSGGKIPPNMRSLEKHKGISGHVVKTGRMYYAPDLNHDREYYLQYFEDTRSELTLPLMDEDGDVIGVLNLESHHVNGFPPQKQSLAESLAQIAGDVLSKERLSRRLDVLNQQLDSLHGVTQGTTIEDVAISILSSVNNILGPETTSSSILLYDQAKNDFTLCRAAGPLREHLEKPPRGKGGKARFMLEHRRPLFESDASTPPDGAPRLRRESLKLGIKSSAILPLMRGTRLTGILFIHTNRPFQFDDQIQNLLIRFADQAAVVIEVNQVFAQQVDYLGTLQEINAAIGKEPVGAVYQKIVEKIRELTGGTASSLWILNRLENRLDIGAASGPNPRKKSLPLDHSSINGHVAITRRPYLCPDVSKDQYYLSWYPKIRSSLTIPMMYGAQLIGTLDVESTGLNAFNEDQRDLLQALGNLAAIALTNARSYESRVNDIVALSEINAAVGERSPREIQRLVVSRAVELTDADYGVLWQLDKANGKLNLLAIEGRKPVELSLPLGMDTVHGKVVGEKKGRIVAESDPDYRGWYADIKSHMQVPMFAGDNLVGTLQVESVEKDAFTSDQMNVLQALANQAAVALEKDRWLKGLTKLNEAGRAISNIASSPPDDSEHAQPGAKADPNINLVAVLRRTSQETIELLDTNATSIWLYDSPSGDLVCEFATPDRGGELVVGKRLKPGEGLAGWCFRNNKNLLAADAFQDERHFRRIEEETHAGLHSVLSVPLRSENRVIGVLQALHEQVGYFQTEHIALLEPLAAFTANAIESVRQIERLRFINDLGKELTSIRSEAELYERIRNRAREIMAATNMFIALFDSKRNEITFPMAYIDGVSINQEVLSTWKRPFGKGLTEEVISKRQPLLMRTKAEQEKWYQLQGINYIQKTFASWLGLPILYSNRVLGIIAAYSSTEEYKFSEDDTQILTLIAGQMAAALVTLREVNALQTLSDNLLKETTSLWGQETSLYNQESA